jgi:hypothetical protein
MFRNAASFEVGGAGGMAPLSLDIAAIVSRQGLPRAVLFHCSQKCLAVSTWTPNKGGAQDDA